MKPVWITRTDVDKPNLLPDSWQALNFPLLTLAPAPAPPNPPQKDDILVFTSGNAVRWFCAFTDERDWPVYTVGDATADKALKAGFSNITSASGDITALSERILSEPGLKLNCLYYVSGQDISGSLDEDLRSQGFNIVREIFYETHPIQHVPAPVQSALTRAEPLAVLLYSPKGANSFRALDLDFARMQTISISNNVDDCLIGLPLIARKIADQPTQAAMIKQLS